MTNYQKRKEKNDEYRSKIMRFTFQLSLGDTEVREWFERQPEKGAYLKDLILRDKAERLGYREQKSAEPDKAGEYEIIHLKRHHTVHSYGWARSAYGVQSKGRNLYDLLSAVQFSRRNNVSRSTCL